MSTTHTEETETLIVKLLRKLERKGQNIQSFLWRLMDEFEDEDFDEKKDEQKVNINTQKITLLYNETHEQVCKVGHQIKLTQHKHLSLEPCIICGHKNNNNIQNKMRPNTEQILQFLNQYNTNQIAFGPHPNQKGAIEARVSKGTDSEWPLHDAAITGDIVKIKQLCKNKNIDVEQKCTDWVGKTPIAAAARYGQLESIIELMKNGANPAQPPDKGNDTPYRTAIYRRHEAVIAFFNQYIKYLYNFHVNDDTNSECYKCYLYDLYFNEHILDGTMAKYVYCKNCTVENVKKLKSIQQNNLLIERRIIKTIKENPSISVDTLCQMKDVKSLHTILKEVLISGSKHAYWLWLLDIDNFKAINTHLTHAIADTKIQALGKVLKNWESMKLQQWKQNGYNGMSRVWAFRQGGDEFALVVKCNNQKRKILQKFYQQLRNNISQIQLGNMKTMTHITVSIGVCHGERAMDYQEMMKNADDAAETVKISGKDGIAIYIPKEKQIYKSFNEI